MMNYGPAKVGFTGSSPYGYPPYGGAPGQYPGGMMQQSAPQAVPPAVPSGSYMTPTGTVMPATNPGRPPLEESYIENILRLNLGKTGTFYMTYENNREWNAKIFKGRIEAAGRDHIIISDPSTGMRFLLLMVNLDYVTFDEPLNYGGPAIGGVPGTAR